MATVLAQFFIVLRIKVRIFIGLIGMYLSLKIGTCRGSNEQWLKLDIG